MENRNYSILKWCVGILAVLNVVLLLNMWRKPPHAPMHPPKHMEGGPRERIISELKFSPDQIDLYEDLIDKHKTSMNELREKGREIRDQYFDLLKQEQVDQKVYSDLTVSIGNNQAEIEKVTFEHFKSVRNLCSLEQKKKFDEIINEVLKGMARPPHGGGPPH
jgi:protein CpxP